MKIFFNPQAGVSIKSLHSLWSWWWDSPCNLLRSRSCDLLAQRGHGEVQPQRARGQQPAAGAHSKGLEQVGRLPHPALDAGWQVGRFLSAFFEWIEGRHLAKIGKAKLGKTRWNLSLNLQCLPQSFEHPTSSEPFIFLLYRTLSSVLGC